MPKKFKECVKKGGKVRTIKPKAGVTMPVCWPQNGSESIAGEPRRKGGRGK